MTAGKRYRVLRAFGTSTGPVGAGEVLRFDSLVEVVNEDEPREEWLMLAFSREAPDPILLWEPQQGQTIASWQEYFEELPDDAEAS